MKPEFCLPNFCDLRINKHASLSLSERWYEVDKRLLYDYISRELLYTSGSNDTKEETIILDMGGPDFINVVKLLRTNIKTGKIETSLDAVTWVEIDSFTSTESSYHYYNDNIIDEYQTITTEEGEPIETEEGVKLEPEYPATLARYIKITAYTTHIPNDEKFLGELYIGRRMIKLTIGKVRRYSFNIGNSQEANVRDNQGYRRRNRVNPVYSDTWSIGRPSDEEADFLTSIEMDGGMYCLFPDPDYGNVLDKHLSIDSIYLIEATGNYIRNPYGQDTNGVFELHLMETRYVD